MLERRTVLDALSWINTGSGNWDVAANWLDSTNGTHRVPGSGDNVTISTTAASTITIQSGDSESVSSLSIAAGDTLAITGGGQLTVSGGYTQDSGSALDLPLDGTRAGLDYGMLDVEGAATLDGQINVTLAAGYTPGANDSFQPLVYTSESGTPTVSVPSGEADFLTQTSLYAVPTGSGSVAVTSTADSGAGSLRDAIDQVNASANPVELISFAIPTTDAGYNASTGVWTISPTSTLPAVAGHAIIDGTTQPGYAGKPAIQLSGGGAGSGVDGLDLNGGHSRVTGLAINGFNGNAINVSGTGFDTLTASFLGTDPTGTVAVPDNQNGVIIQNGATNDTIGGTTAGAANVISGNSANGVFIRGSGTSGNLVAGNFIGTNATGTAALANGSGVVIRGAATNNTIGRTTVGASNIISGNDQNGVWIGDAGTSGNSIESNFIGIDAAGNAALGNGANGVAIQNGATNNTAGGTAAGAGNVISGNVGSGVSVSSAGTSLNLVEGNRIGTNAAGTAALANGGNGLQIINGATNNTVGGTAVGAGNVISCNGSHSTANGTYSGVFISGSGTSDNLLEGNFIGTDTAGTAALGNNGTGVVIRGAATNNTIGGTTLGASNIISGNANGGVWIGDAGTSGNSVESNFIGTDGVGNAALGNGATGVAIQNGATNNTVGGNATGAGNVISGNVGSGVSVGGAGTSLNLVEGNRIGTNASGDAAIGNNGNGVQITSGATDNTIGGTAPGAGNVISGNDASAGVYGGVFIDGTGTSGNLVAGNFIGTNATGTAALANGFGVVIRGAATMNTIGAATPGASNIISGNANGGVWIGVAGTSQNLVEGNLIGTNAAGNAALGNGQNGVAIRDGATNNIIGGTAPGAGNVVSGNGGAFNGSGDGHSAVYLGDAGTSGNQVLGNFIGTNAAGAAIGNSNDGIEIVSGAGSNFVGGSAAGAANTIAFNGHDGVLVDTGAQNLISENSIFSNGHLGIELTNNGNNSQAAPVLTSVTSAGSTTTVTGSLMSAANTSFKLEFFASAVAGISTVGEGQTFLGAKSVATDASGIADFTATLPVNLPANEQLVTATATDPNQDTSAFSNGVMLTASPFHLTDDVYVIGSGTISVPAGSGVLANDTGPSQLTVTSTTVAGAEGGTFKFSADGSFTYTPPINSPGFDYARYTAQDASGGQGMATVDVLSQTGGVVWKFYEQVLHRDPDYAGLQGWLNDFSSGGKPGDIALGFFESTELLNQIITGYYEQYLGRAPQGNDLTGWEAVWRQTGGPEGIKAGFADSPEFYNSNGATPASWLSALYEKILQRTPDQAGYDGWLKYYQQQLAAGVDAGTIRYQIALDFFASPEAYDNDVTGWFYEYLDRAPTLAEQAQYANQMTAGANDRTIEQDITNLPEYSNNPPASPSGTATPLPNYLPATSAAKIQDSVVATDAVFAGVR